MLEKLQELLKTMQDFEALVHGIYTEYGDNLLNDDQCIPGLPFTLFTIFAHSMYVGRHAFEEMVKLIEFTVANESGDVTKESEEISKDVSTEISKDIVENAEETTDDNKDST